MLITRRKMMLLAVAAAGGLVATDAAVVEPNWLSFETLDVPIRGLHAALDGFRIALLSDMHWPRHISAEFCRRAVTIGNAFRPDLWAFAGDFCDAKGVVADTPLAPGTRNVPNMSGLFEEMSATHGVVGVRGNHDHWIDGRAIAREVERCTPIRLIESKHLLLERGGGKLAIGGIGDLWTDTVDPLAAFDGVGEDVPRVMLSHNPDVAEEMKQHVRVDLQLSGHTHGGEVRVPFGPAPAVPSRYGNKFRQGLVGGRKHRVYVTRGICRPRGIRFWCRPEVTGIVLRGVREM